MSRLVLCGTHCVQVVAVCLAPLQGVSLVATLCVKSSMSLRSDLEPLQVVWEVAPEERERERDRESLCYEKFTAESAACRAAVEGAFDAGTAAMSS